MQAIRLKPSPFFGLDALLSLAHFAAFTAHMAETDRTAATGPWVCADVLLASAAEYTFANMQVVNGGQQSDLEGASPNLPSRIL